MGGTIGVILAEMIPERLLSLTTIEPDLIGEDCTFTRHVAELPYEKFKTEFFDKLMGMASAKKFSGDVIEKLKSAYVITDDIALKLFLKYNKGTNPYVFYKSSKVLVEISDTEKLLGKFLKLNAKKCYIYGEKNNDMPILKLLPNVNKIEIAKSGHFVMFDNPKYFYNKLAEFLMA